MNADFERLFPIQYYTLPDIVDNDFELVVSSQFAGNLPSREAQYRPSIIQQPSFISNSVLTLRDG